MSFAASATELLLCTDCVLEAGVEVGFEGM